MSWRTAGAVWLLLLVCFIALALRAAYGDVLAVDVTLTRWLQRLPEATGAIFSLINWLGNSWPLTAVTLAAASAFAWRGDRDAALLMLLSFLPRISNSAVKRLVSEPRPDAELVRVEFPHDHLSFPSGHVVGITSVFALLFILAPSLAESRPVVLTIRTVCVMAIATVGAARIWVGAHWPSDALAGYIYAALFLLPAIVWVRSRSRSTAA